MIKKAAMTCGFTGGIVIDYPNSTKAKKCGCCRYERVFTRWLLRRYFLVLSAGEPIKESGGAGGSDGADWKETAGRDGDPGEADDMDTEGDGDASAAGGLVTAAATGGSVAEEHKGERKKAMFSRPA